MQQLVKIENFRQSKPFYYALFTARTIYCAIYSTIHSSGVARILLWGAAGWRGLKGRSLRPTEPKVKVKADRQERGSYQLGGLGKCCKLRQLGLDRSPRSQTFLTAMDGHWWYLNLVATDAISPVTCCIFVWEVSDACILIVDNSNELHCCS